ncbi:MAG: AAA family ATPase, partial [Planctomycetes bacterium]|nr:AAA family ATPase [Planctomycetota bacterium]
KIPTPPRQLKPNIPRPISDIVMKLLAKTAEKRYQSNYGLKADLEICLTQWQIDGKIDDFTPGQQDISDRFQIPQKLYGREQEIKTLLAAFDWVNRGTAEMMLVTGFSGVGKSVLVYEINKSIAQKRGYFISGEFDQFQRNVPYIALLRAFQGLMWQLLTESEERITDWKESLLAALGPNGQVIIDVIPAVELIIGPQPPVAELGLEESQNRFNLVFQNFINVFARQEHPLVIFWDDLQWADSASLKLLRLFMTNPDSQYLLFIGSYRDSEVGPAHPLTLTLDEIKKAKVVVNHIALKPLAIDHITELMADTLSCRPEQVESLAELVLNKTGGNPFFLNQFLMTLYEEQFIVFDSHKGVWRWQVEEIETVDITDNVVELMAAKIQKLPAQTQHALQLAACIGNQFDLNTLTTVSEKSAAETFDSLWLAVQEGLILQLDRWVDGQAGNLASGRARFLHDRVKEAAYSLLPEGGEREVHYQVGRLMLKNTSGAEREDKIFDIVNQLDFGI